MQLAEKNEPQNRELTLSEVAKEIMENHDLLTDMVSNIIYVYDRGIWKPEGENIIKEVAGELWQDDFTTSKLSNLTNYIQSLTFARQRQVKEPELNLICLDNGILDFNTMKLEDFNHNYFFITKIPVKYDLKADCPKFKTFLVEVIYQDDIIVLQEYLGYCLYRSYPIAKAWVGIGDGSNGKSTLLEVIKIFLGKINISSKSLQELSFNRFAKAELYGKTANIYADLPDQALEETGTFKMLTGKDVMTAEFKYRQGFPFDNYAKLFFSCNKLPETNDDTDAFMRRWLPTSFPFKFEEGSGREPKQKDHLIADLTTQEELSGILNWALEGLKRLLSQGHFSYSKTTEQIREYYNKMSSPLQAFFIDCLEESPSEYIEKKELYSVFCAYCREKKLPIYSSDRFYKNLPQVVQIIDYRPEIEEKRIHTFKGIKYSQKGKELLTVSIASTQNPILSYIDNLYGDKSKENNGHKGQDGSKER